MKKWIVPIVCVFLLIVCSNCTKEEVYEDDKPIIKFVQKESILEKEDGWYESVLIAGPKGPIEENEYDYSWIKTDNCHISFDGFNLKHKNLDGYYKKQEDEEGNIINKMEPDMPTYSIFWEQREELDRINAYLNEKKLPDLFL